MSEKFHRIDYKLGVDLADGYSKSIVVIVPKHGDVLDLSKDMDMILRRIAEALEVPIELIDPECVKIHRHPAFDNGATVRRITARLKKPTE